MHTPWDIIKKLESNNSRTFKEEVILAEMLSNNEDLFRGIRLCLDSLITFGVKKVPEKLDGSRDITKALFTDESDGLSWDEFENSIKHLIDRTVTGHAAADLIYSMMQKASDVQWNYWYRRILIKDLRCGTSEKTINKVAKQLDLPQYSVPVFTCQLASQSEDHEKKMIGLKQIDVKMDGARVLSILHPDGRVEQYSRNGKALENFPNIVHQLEKYCEFIDAALVLDGEVMSSSFQDLMKQIHRKENVETDDATLHLFDIVPLEKFIAGFYDIPQCMRSLDLYNLINKVDESDRPNVKVIDNELIDLDTDEGKNRLLEINKYAIEGGYEGIMIKDVNGPYECKRATSWLKLKPFITVDLEVIGYEEGSGKNVGKLGALIVAGYHEEQYIRTNVGSGLTDEDRALFWDCREDLVGRTAEIKADTITQSQDSDNEYSLRFPVFLHFRGDK